jgi:transposase
VPEEVTLQELIAQKDQRIRELEADKQQLSQEIKLLKEKVDLLIRRLFSSKSEKLDPAQLELLLKDLDLGKADASAEKAEAAPIVEVLKPVTKRPDKQQRRERWPKELAVEQEIIEPEEVRANPEAFRCIGEEITEMLDYRPAKFFRRQIIRRKFVHKQQTELSPIIAALPESLQQRCIAAPGLLAQVIVSKYCDHCAPRAADEEIWHVRCATAQPMREEKAPRDRLSGAGPKSPSAAVVKSHGREHRRKRSGKGSDQIGDREMNESEPLMTCRNVYQMRSKPGGRGCPGISMDETCFGPCGLRHEGGMTLLRGGSVERGNLPHRW